jgi:hypothetical protein
MMIVETGYRRVAVGIDSPLAEYAVRDVRREFLPRSGETVGSARRALVEIYRGVGGNPQRALIGGTLAPSTKQRLEVELQVSQNRPSGSATTCPGAFGRDLVPGLAEEFIDSIPDALMTQIAHPGMIVIDRAAYDEVESSVNSFALAAELLAIVLSHESPMEAEGAIRQRLSEW